MMDPLGKRKPVPDEISDHASPASEQSSELDGVSTEESFDASAAIVMDGPPTTRWYHGRHCVKPLLGNRRQDHDPYPHNEPKEERRLILSDMIANPNRRQAIPLYASLYRYSKRALQREPRMSIEDVQGLLNEVLPMLRMGQHIFQMLVDYSQRPGPVLTTAQLLSAVHKNTNRSYTKIHLNFWYDRVVCNPLAKPRYAEMDKEVRLDDSLRRALLHERLADIELQADKAIDLADLRALNGELIVDEDEFKKKKSRKRKPESST